MEKEKMIDDIERYMETQKEVCKKREKLKGRRFFDITEYFHSHFAGKFMLAGFLFNAFLFGGYFALPLFGIATGLPAAAIVISFGVVGFVAGFFLPKLIHKICINLKGKFGRKYAKNYVYNGVHNHYVYNLICNKEVVKAERTSKIPQDKFKDFVKYAKSFPTSYKYDLDECMGNKIAKRHKKDFNKISKLLNSGDVYSQRTQDKINKIIEKNEKFVKPWCDLYNECGEYGIKFEEHARDFNKDMPPIVYNRFKADVGFLRKKVNRYIKQNGYQSVEFDAEAITDNEQQSTLKNYTRQSENVRTKEETRDLIK